jgi:hypothetical protein
VRIALAVAASVLVLLVAFFVIVRAVGDRKIDCRGFALRPGQWQATSPYDRSLLVSKIGQCRALDGRTPGQVEQLLGPPDRTKPAYSATAYQVKTYRFGARDVRYMEVRIRGGRVFQIGRVDATTPPPG